VLCLSILLNPNDSLFQNLHPENRFLKFGSPFSFLQTDQTGAIICVVAAQIANLCESFIGAALQGRKGYEWVPLLHLRLDSQTIVCCSFPM
jgi:hypothetical protein